MKRLFWIVILALFIAASVGFAVRIPEDSLAGQEIRILLLYHPELKNDHSASLNAWVSVLEEEGVPFSLTTPSTLLANDPEETAGLYPALILPDALCRRLPDDIAYWVIDYLDNGGSLMVVYDAGVLDFKRAYMETPLFAGILGVQYNPYVGDEERAFTLGHIQFRNEASANLFQFPKGKIFEDLTIGGYQNPKLLYHVVRSELLPAVDSTEVHAWAVVPDESQRYPALVWRRIRQGNVLYVNLPLGDIKAYGSDDLPIRSVVRSFLFSIVKVPHLMSTPGGIGGIVMNWHIDNYKERTNIPRFIEEGVLRKDLFASIHITGGEFVHDPGDNQGFEACGAGESVVKLAQNYGAIGSHGGWRHDWFAENIKNGTFGEKEIAYYIEKNNQCLQSITGEPVIEYSAPVGVHPQPLATRVLEKLGVIAYYYAGDSGSVPNRTFMDGTMISRETIAFPVMPMGPMASLFEIFVNGIDPEVVEDFLVSTADFAARTRTVRLVYSHLYDLADQDYYLDAFKAFVAHMADLQDANRLEVRSMSDYALFIKRFLKTETRFIHTAKGMEVVVKNPESLERITVAIPREGYRQPEGGVESVDSDKTYYYVHVKGEANEARISVFRD